MNNYAKYRSEDFLNDDYFNSSILSPTRESDRFWNELIDREEIDIHEYTNAVLMLLDWEKSVQKADDADLEKAWQRIKHSVSEKKKRNPSKLYFVVAGIAAFLTGILFLLLPLLKEPKVEIPLPAGYKIISMAQENNDVTIVSNNNELKVEGEKPAISYNQQGNLSLGDSKGESLTAAVEETVFNTLIVPFGKMAHLELSDGSKIYVNAGSSVIYPRIFSGNERKITVNGEIFAEIAHDGRPFVVQSHDVSVTVRGTTFNLSSYSSDNFSNVVLVSGKVDVTHNNETCTLAPSQAFQTDAEGASVRSVDTDLYTSWTEGVYRFENESIENVMLKLSRYYNTTLVMPDSPSGIICYGALELKDSMTDILTGLMKVASFKFFIKNDAYYISFD